MTREPDVHAALSRIEREVGMDKIVPTVLARAIRERLVTMQAGRPWLTGLGEKTLDEWDEFYGVPVVR